MEVIHILGDEKTQFTEILKLDDGIMALIGFDLREETGWGRKPLLLSGPDAIGSPEIRQTRFRADPRSRKNDQILRLEHPLG
jgi:hypothetical protein